jgi:hypothetical protein
MTEAEKLIENILAEPALASSGILANRLLREYHRGYPVQTLKPLLANQNEYVVRLAAFVASELGSRAKPLLREMVRLLSHRNLLIRSDAICAVLTCADRNEQSAIAAVINLLEDPNWPIRWKTMEFLSLASLQQLQAGLEHLEKAHSPHVEALRWLVRVDESNIDEIPLWLESNVSLNRKYGVVAAAKVASLTYKHLQRAASSDDVDVKRFAESVLQTKAAIQ